jgi:hypothetical protein
MNAALSVHGTLPAATEQQRAEVRRSSRSLMLKKDPCDDPVVGLARYRDVEKGKIMRTPKTSSQYCNFCRKQIRRTRIAKVASYHKPTPTVPEEEESIKKQEEIDIQMVQYDDEPKENGDGADSTSHGSIGTLDLTEHRFEKFQPHQFSAKIKRRQRLVHAFKVGLGILITSQFVIVDALNELFRGFGAWAVITVMIVTLPTPGDTTQKVINRTAGTLIGAGLAVFVGFIASELSEVLYPAGQVFVSAANCSAAISGALLYTRGGPWSYAFFLGTVTFVFLSIQVLDGGMSEAIFRGAMIALGGMIAFLISWMPPRVRASDVARAYLADAMLDTSVCAELVVHNFLTGKPLNSINGIYSGDVDDTFHQLSKTIQISRVSLEEAIAAAKYEAAGKQGKIFKTSGLAVRLALRTLLSADMMLRHEFCSLDKSKENEERLGMALTNVVSSIRSAFAQKVLDLNCSLPPGFDAFSELDLPVALSELKCALLEYVRLGCERIQTDDVVNGFACHVSFARLIYDSGRFIVDAAPNMVPSETRRKNVTSMALGI